MKQTGKTWLNAEGHPTLAKYVPKHEQISEALGQRIAASAVALEAKLITAKAEFVRMAQEVLRNNPDQGLKTRFTFHTFDREYRIEYDIKEENVRVYQATKANPSAKDYRFVDLSFTRTSVTSLLEREKPANHDSAAQHPYTMDEVGLTPKPKLSDIINDEAGPLGLLKIEFVDTKGNSLTDGKGLIEQLPPASVVDASPLTEEEIEALAPREGPREDDEEESTFDEQEALDATPKPDEEEKRMIPGTSTNEDGANIMSPEEAAHVSQVYADREQEAREQE